MDLDFELISWRYKFWVLSYGVRNTSIPEITGIVFYQIWIWSKKQRNNNSSNLIFFCLSQISDSGRLEALSC